MTKHVYAQLFRSAFDKLDELPPLAGEKNPYVAALCGFLAGGVGLGLYLRSWADLIFPFVIAFVLVIGGIPTGGLLTLLTPFAWAAYGWKRATSSNKKLSEQNRSARVIDVEVITEPPPLFTSKPTAHSN